MKWQPIETARKDNRAVLGYFPEYRCIFCMVWDDEDQRWECFGGDGDFYGEKPTHWRDVPKRPKATP